MWFLFRRKKKERAGEEKPVEKSADNGEAEGKKKTKRIVTAKAETRREVEELAKMATSEDTAYIETTTTEAHEAAQELKTDVYRKGEEVKRKIKKLNGDICSSGEIHVK